MLDIPERLKKLIKAQQDKSIKENKLVVHPDLVPLEQKHKTSLEQYTKYPDAKR